MDAPLHAAFRRDGACRGHHALGDVPRHGGGQCRYRPAGLEMDANAAGVRAAPARYGGRRGAPRDDPRALRPPPTRLLPHPLRAPGRVPRRRGRASQRGGRGSLVLHGWHPPPREPRDRGPGAAARSDAWRTLRDELAWRLLRHSPRSRGDPSFAGRGQRLPCGHRRKPCHGHGCHRDGCTMACNDHQRRAILTYGQDPP